MARVTTTLTPLPVLFPYSGIGSRQADESNAVQAEISFQINGDAITLSGVGDDQELIIDINLPRAFSYVHLESHIGIICDDSAQWEPVAWGGLQNGGNTSARKYIAPVEFFSNGATTFGARRIWTAQSQIKALIDIASDTKGKWQFRVGNPTTNQDAGTCFALIRFLQFSIAQQNDYRVNTPTPTR